MTRHEHPLNRSQRLALQRVAAGEWWHAAQYLGWLTRNGFVVDQGPGFGGDPQRYALTDEGRSQLARWSPRGVA